MDIQYRFKNEKVEIVRCFGADAQVEIPAQIMGREVAYAAPYAFSARKRKEDTDVFTWRSGSEANVPAAGIPGADMANTPTAGADMVNARAAGEPTAAMPGEPEELLAGERIESVVFPETMREIGNYIFYGCKNLCSLEFSDCLMNIGSGAFTGCSTLSKLTVHMRGGEKTCVKEILGDLWQRIDVHLVREGSDDKTDEYGCAVKPGESAKYGRTAAAGSDAVLVFPEHFEEAVENTPARILFTQHHGSGNNYRQCFYNKEVDYEKYDSLFSVAVVYDRVDVLTDLAFGRLLHPTGLSTAYLEMYSAYLRENAKEVGEYLVRAQKQEELGEMGRRGFWTKEALDAVIQYAAAGENRAAVSALMDDRQRLFPAQRRRRYEL